MTARERPLEAPHRRLESSSRILERTAVLAYRGAGAFLAHVPAAPAAWLLGRFAQLSYALWPTKRRWSNANFGHILGLPPEHPAVRRLALAAYAHYGRYIVELMRLPSRPHAELAAAVDAASVHEVAAAWRESDGPLIIAAFHLANSEAVGAALAEHGYPVHVVADDSSFPELFELLRRQRETWAVRLVPWRNLRAIFEVLRRREILVLVVDWGYRPDGIPVRLFDAWTTLPAGPATLAARSGAPIVPIAVRRGPGGHGFVAHMDEPIRVASSAPAELLRATQELADATARAIGAAPSEWYSFKPLWPLDPAESARLEERARKLAAGEGRGRRAIA
ncbi:MAG: lysophospholipid acyltransferase family protein [Chloroflexota bacterium]